MGTKQPKPKPVFTGAQKVDRPRVVSPIAHAVARGALESIVAIGWNPAVSDGEAAKAMWQQARTALAAMGGGNDE